jgi:NitT/TauT family transport system permease protein
LDSFFHRVWGEATAMLRRTRRFGLIDVVMLGAIVGAIFGMVNTAREWTGVYRPAVTIDLSAWALPKYTFFSLSRGLAAYALSLGFTLVYGYWAAKDRVAERVLIPLLDILQSLPILAFLPPLELALVALFPTSNIGLELTAVIAIFTSQAWNMTFSFYYSLKNVPQDMVEVSQVYRFSWWQRLRQVEVPFATIGLVWNSMMSMAGGWFFLMAAEAFQLQDKNFQLPGLGSYMKVAVDRGDHAAAAWAIFAMVLMIVALDQLLWRPVVVWSQKFRMEEGGQVEEMRSWALDILRRSEVVGIFMKRVEAFFRERLQNAVAAQPTPKAPPNPIAAQAGRFAPLVMFATLVVILLVGGWKFVGLLRLVETKAWAKIFGSAGFTLTRVLFSTLLGTLWTLPAGLAIGSSPRLSRILQPVVQVIASFPAPMLFPAFIALLTALHISLGLGSVVLMLLGTQWYILFNVIAGATAIPADLREAAHSYRILGMQRFWVLYFPALFPYLVTGWVTAAGGAWNASIISEYVTSSKGEAVFTVGLGSLISQATAGGNFPLLAASVLVMSLMVVTFNRLVWKRLHRLAETRYSLQK